MNIYQIYYNDNSKKGLDKAFIPYNNTIPKMEKEFEYGVMRNLYLENKLFMIKYDKHAGVMSWKFNQKTGTAGRTFVDWIKKNKGYDVYFINPWPEHSTLYFNIWYQGEDFHPGLIDLTEKLFKDAGIEIDIRHSSRNTIKTLCFCNYWVGSREFWDRYISYTEKLYTAIYNSDDETKRLLFDIKADKVIDSAFFSFIMERMFSAVLANENFKTMPYFDINAAKRKSSLLKNMLEIYYPIVRDIDKSSVYSNDDISFINSIGKLYHDKVFNRFSSIDNYLCGSYYK